MSEHNTPAPDGQVWVCRDCGKTSITRSGFLEGGAPCADPGWDVSCGINAELHYKKPREGLHVVAVAQSDEPSLEKKTLLRRDLRLRVQSDFDTICIIWGGIGIGREDMARGIIEASQIMGAWWVNRALIQPASARNQGVGGIMLDVLLETIIGRGGDTVLVCPGGYDPGRLVDQERFYQAHGFELVERHDIGDGLYRWRKK